MSWDKKPKLTKLNQFADLIQKAVDLEIEHINKKLEAIKIVLEKKQKHDMATKNSKQTPS